MLRIEDKKVLADQMFRLVKDAQSIIVVDYSGLTSNQMNALRAKARGVEVVVRIIRNTLMRRAVQGTVYEKLAPALSGSVMVLLSLQDPSAAAKVIVEYLKSNQVIVKALSVGGGDLLLKDQLVAVSKLPTKQESLAMFVNVCQSPVFSLVQLLHSVPMHLVGIFEALLAKKTEEL